MDCGAQPAASAALLSAAALAVVSPSLSSMCSFHTSCRPLVQNGRHSLVSVADLARKTVVPPLTLTTLFVLSRLLFATSAALPLFAYADSAEKEHHGDQDKMRVCMLGHLCRQSGGASRWDHSAYLRTHFLFPQCIIRSPALRDGQFHMHGHGGLTLRPTSDGGGKHGTVSAHDSRCRPRALSQGGDTKCVSARSYL
ncbi:hypothetical protein FA95DRAFT_317600 [Auriscalpium vulgare]|uniref:Uncharacterized protein n=1 Tax=Auriscalpium vulgare TaxID=40419 RepID=A0ACB8S5H2_9AGAM|nr:hypothetical protein FA95DRAFT_317600 [Auriscalpium vulgare]